MLKRIRDSIHAYEQGVMPSGGTVFTQKGIEYGIDAAKALEEKLTETYTRYINNREKLLNSSRTLDEITGREKVTNQYMNYLQLIRRYWTEILLHLL